MCFPQNEWLLNSAERQRNDFFFYRLKQEAQWLSNNVIPTDISYPIWQFFLNNKSYKGLQNKLIHFNIEVIEPFCVIFPRNNRKSSRNWVFLQILVQLLWKFIFYSIKLLYRYIENWQKEWLGLSNCKYQGNRLFKAAWV